MYELTCKLCGMTYTSGIKKQGYCPECRKVRQIERNKEYLERKNKGATRKLGSPDLCTNCGKPYVVKSGLQVLCPECIEKGIRNRTKSKQSYLDKYDLIKVYTPKGEKEKIQAFAKSRNMSTNEFVNYAIYAIMKQLEEFDKEPF